MVDIKTFPLRQRKMAKTRLSILDSLIDRLDNKSFEKITIEDICDDVEISKATFFNYFAKKTDILLYFILLWNLEAMWHSTKTPDVSPGVDMIGKIFTWHARKVDQHPRLWMELIALRVNKPLDIVHLGKNKTNRVDTVERILRFPDLKGIESIPEGNFRRLFIINLENAIKKGELPKGTNIENAFMSLACIFYGVPLMVSDRHPINTAEIYPQQLQLLWDGLRAQ
jgi:AcrR family transcriptional regulator